MFIMLVCLIYILYLGPDPTKISGLISLPKLYLVFIPPLFSAGVGLLRHFQNLPKCCDLEVFRKYVRVKGIGGGSSLKF